MTAEQKYELVLNEVSLPSDNNSDGTAQQERAITFLTARCDPSEYESIHGIVCEMDAESFWEEVAENY